jgi:hypothetical protein
MLWTLYNATLTAEGGIAPYKWSIVSGVLPQGLYLDQNSGRIYGWVNQQGTFKFTVGVTEALGGYATKDLLIEVKPDTGAYWSGGWGVNPVYTPYVRFGYAAGKPADVTTFKLYQRKPGEASFSAVGTFSAIAETCGSNYSPTDSLWSLYFACSTTYSFWSAYLKTATSSSAFPVGEYNYYVAGVKTDGAETSITPILKLFALEKTKILSPTELQSPVASTTLKFEWTVAQSGWPTNVSRPYYYIMVYPEGYGPVYYNWGAGQVGVPTATYAYNGVELDPTKKYLVNILNYPTTVTDNTLLAKSSYISMIDSVTRFWISR